LEEAANEDNPLLERLKFLAIFESNLDEFYMVRVSGLIEQFESGLLELSPDGLTPNEQLKAISETAGPLRRRADEVFRNQIAPALDSKGIRILKYECLTTAQKRHLNRYFAREVFPLCTPLVLHPAPSAPFISNRSLNLAVQLSDNAKDVRLARVKIPEGIPRAVQLAKSRYEFVMLEDIIAHNLQSLFPGVEIVGAHLFRVLRDADVEIRELEAADLITTIEETIRLRRFGDPVLLEVASGMPQSVRTLLMSLHRLDEEDVMEVDGLLGMEAFWEFARIDKPSLRFPPHIPYVPEELSNFRSIFDSISQRDVLIHLPYDGFRPLEEFVASAVRDTDVVGIKQTLYRVGAESPIVESLLDAAGEGKQVAAMVELKARFDESNNLEWARALERAGVHVTYGFTDKKTHCKLCLVVRREHGKLHMYAHIGTGNYNPVTARIYTDLGLFTDDEAITQDVLELFNYLTGFSKQTKYRKLLVAPLNLREGILERIRHETLLHKRQGGGRIVWKLNALVDPEVIEALYEAGHAGVKVDLIVRGVCCLRPGVVGLSENIRVTSIVGRFLEHSRIYYFSNGGEPQVLIGSADAMRRNLDRRIEVLAPVEDPRLIAAVHDRILEVCLRDNVRAWDLGSDGLYSRRACGASEPFDSQNWFMANPLSKELFAKSDGQAKSRAKLAS
jgi:polyphosphate kinase